MKHDWIILVERLKSEKKDLAYKLYAQDERHEKELCQAFATGAAVMFIITALGFIAAYLFGWFF